MKSDELYEVTALVQDIVSCAKLHRAWYAQQIVLLHEINVNLQLLQPKWWLTLRPEDFISLPAASFSLCAAQMASFLTASNDNLLLICTFVLLQKTLPHIDRGTLNPTMWHKFAAGAHRLMALSNVETDLSRQKLTILNVRDFYHFCVSQQ